MDAEFIQQVDIRGEYALLTVQRDKTLPFNRGIDAGPSLLKQTGCGRQTVDRTGQHLRPGELDLFLRQRRNRVADSFPHLLVSNLAGRRASRQVRCMYTAMSTCNSTRNLHARLRLPDVAIDIKFFIGQPPAPVSFQQLRVGPGFGLTGIERGNVAGFGGRVRAGGLPDSLTA